jgi:hypothetical protein
MKNWTFYRLLHSRRDREGRRMTIRILAEQIGTRGSHLCEVLNNRPGHGHQTRVKLFRVLTYEEIRALGWWEEFLQWLRVPRGTSSQRVCQKCDKISNRQNLQPAYETT